MSRNPDSRVPETNSEQLQAGREGRARERLASDAEGSVAAQPWRPAHVPPSDIDLAHFALWQFRNADSGEVLDGLALLSAARAEVEGLEAGLLFAARSSGLTWAQIASAMGFKSPQACQQHYTRLLERQSGA
ncbi:SANT/Myb-like DNA-binding domain-containing protein [Paramicrobacterium fandaimingii]|uniref:SANT/Myb-like DNA-binding domain-containing protein n=1 Tax=Paramicrobacterium fandaimingii TaxID=2708079 RepID=UPI0014244C43|nr:SANT/Myb-like DNA-binding domain-containing protein [Microbacterium fandaimingii]